MIDVGLKKKMSNKRGRPPGRRNRVLPIKCETNDDDKESTTTDLEVG